MRAILDIYFTLVFFHLAKFSRCKPDIRLCFINMSFDGNCRLHNKHANFDQSVKSPSDGPPFLSSSSSGSITTLDGVILELDGPKQKRRGAEDLPWRTLNPASAAADAEDDGVVSAVEGTEVDVLAPFFWFIDFAHLSMSCDKQKMLKEQ